MFLFGYVFKLTIFIVIIQSNHTISCNKTNTKNYFCKPKNSHLTNLDESGKKIHSDLSPQAQCNRCELFTPGIYCMCQTREFDIIEQMTNISLTLDPSGLSKEFDSFTFYDGIISEFPDNSFIDLKFKSIVIENAINLQRIHTNAFNSTALYTNATFIVWGDTNKNFSLRNEPPEYDFWAAISSLVNVRTMQITLGHNMAHEIPDNAFRQINGPQNNLIEIDFVSGYTISRIGEYAFSQLPNLNDIKIDLSNIPIQHIAQHAFAFIYPSDRIVNIILTNCDLNEDHFDGAFIGNNRPIWLYLSHNNFRCIREEVFYDFFNSHRSSLLFIEDNPLNCNDSAPFEWLLLSPIRNDYMARIIYPYCENGTVIWDLNVGSPDVTTPGLPQATTTGLPQTPTPGGSNSDLFSFKVKIAII